MSSSKVFTDTPMADNTNITTAGSRGPALLLDIWLIEKMAYFDGRCARATAMVLLM